MKERCPVCGSADCVDLLGFLSSVACPRCGCKNIVGMVRERTGEFAIVDWFCRVCARRWSDSRVLPEEFKPKSVIWAVFR